MGKSKIFISKSDLKLFALVLFFFAITKVNAEVEYSTPLHGKEFKMGNRVEWKTAYEQNTKMFILEKSDDAVSYTHLTLPTTPYV